MAPEAGVRIEPPAGRMALTAVRISIDVRVVTGELPGRQELGACGTWCQRSSDSSRYHQAAQDRESGDTPPHSEKIQRYP
jgi:hypothetical protein